MRTLSILLGAFFVAPSLLFPRGGVYLEPRADVLHVPGTPNIGDIGRKVSQDFDAFALGGVLGYELADHLHLELRYTRIGRFRVTKQSSNLNIFPPLPGQFVLPAILDYDYEQRSNLFSLAVPVSLLPSRRITLSITPMVVVEDSDVTLTEFFLGSSNGEPLTRREIRLVQRSARVAHPAGEIMAGWRLTDRLLATVHYTYLPLDHFDAHLFGISVAVRF